MEHVVTPCDTPEHDRILHNQEGTLIEVGLKLARPELTSHQVAELVRREHEEARLREMVYGHRWL